MTVFGHLEDGRTVEKVTITRGDLTVSILTLGAILQDVRLSGIPYSLTNGSDNVADYQGDMRYHGSLIGPIINRIGAARVEIDGMMYELERNENKRSHLHSGSGSTLFQVWDIVEQRPSAVTLSCILTDGQAGLPGHRVITATYAVTDDNSLSLEIDGTTDTPTLMNIANHSYWNLDGSKSWEGHSLQISANQYLPTTADNLPTGEVTSVADTPFDFRETRQISPQDPKLDNNFCLSTTNEPVRNVLMLRGTTGVQLTVATDQTGIQVFDERSKYQGLAIEAQGWPDAPSFRHFPNIRVTPNEPYHQMTIWKFNAGKH